jgi:hypothetical protein
MNSLATEQTGPLGDSASTVVIVYNADHPNQNFGETEKLKAQVKSDLVSTKEQVFGAPINPTETGMPARYHPHPETVEDQVPGATLMDNVTRSLVSAQESAQAGLASAKDRVFGEAIVPVEGGMPGRNHPDPEPFEVPVPTLLDRVKTTAQEGFASTQAGLLSAKNAIFGEKIEPIEGGMPGRNHPCPEAFEAPTPTLLERVKTGAQQGLASTQAGLLSAKNAVFGEKIEPIEGGMPGRYHPHPEMFEVPPPTLLDRVKTGAQQGLAFTEAGLLSAKNAVFGEKVEPIEGGMPGRNHPHPEMLEAPAPTLMEKMKDGLFSAEKTVQSGLTTGFSEAKKRVWGAKIEPIEGGMPGRNHPHPERFYAPTPSFIEKVKSTLVSAEKLAETKLLKAKNRVWGVKIEPIEGGMPGRNHPHPERFYAPTPTLMDKMKGGLVSVQVGLTSAKDKVMSLTETVEPIEGGMPGRNHPCPETFEAPAPGIMDKMKDGLTSTQLGLTHAKERVFGKTAQPVTGMPGRNHPDPKPFEAQAPGFISKIQGVIGFDKKVETQPEEIPAQSQIEKESIDMDVVRDQLEETLAKETVHPLQGMPGPGRNHPMADPLKAQDQGILNKLSDKLKNVFIGEKDGGSV